MKSATLVADLQFGDAGKGATVDALARRLGDPLVVRHHGGPQAAHNVWLSEDRSHTFAQFGSGALAGAPTHLSRFMLVNPVTWGREWLALRDRLWAKAPNTTTTVEEEAVVITPYHRALNQARELARKGNAHGTTGHGVGEVMMDVLNGRTVLTVGDLCSLEGAARILREIADAKSEEIRALGGTVPGGNMEYLEACRHFIRNVMVVDRSWLLRQQRDLIFEGAQGVLLDQDYGFHPHTTWSDCTFGNAMALLDVDDFEAPVTKIGVLRSYMTRHGAGPFPTEDPTLDLGEVDNDSAGWAGAWRNGHPDLVLWRYALEVLGGVDYLSLTHLDALPKLDRYAYAYRVPHARRKCTLQCDCLCHDTQGAVHDHPGEPCPGKDEVFAGLNPFWCHSEDLEAREALTRTLFEVEPMYAELPFAEHFVEWIEAELGASVLLRSNGRFAKDRHWSSPKRARGKIVSPFSRRAEPVVSGLLN